MREWICVCCRKIFGKRRDGPDTTFTGICPACDIQVEREAREMREQVQAVHGRSEPGLMDDEAQVRSQAPGEARKRKHGEDQAAGEK